MMNETFHAYECSDDSAGVTLGNSGLLMYLVYLLQKEFACKYCVWEPVKSLLVLLLDYATVLDLL